MWKLLWIPLIFIFAFHLLQFDRGVEEKKASPADHQIVVQKPSLSPDHRFGHLLEELTPFNSLRSVKGKQQDVGTFFPSNPSYSNQNSTISYCYSISRKEGRSFFCQ